MSYAQGTAKAGNQDFDRQAFSIDTNAVLVALKDSPDKPACRWTAPDSPPGTTPDFGPANEAYTQCVDARLKELASRWNVSRVSFSVATGTAKAESVTRFSLGRIMAASMVYGFDHFGLPTLRDNAALSLTWRRSFDAPVLGSSSLDRQTSNLLAVRLTGGSAKWRLLVEGSKLSESRVSAQRQVFRHAIGVDLQLSEGLWLNVRTGKLRRDGTGGLETATLMDLSFSPKALLR